MRHIGLIACFAIVASLFALVIGLGYEINEGTPLGSVSAPAGGVLILSVAVLLWHLSRQGPVRLPLFPPRPAVKTKPVTDPRPEYAAYNADPMRLTTCYHLQPMEGVMRRGGITLTMRSPGIVSADCTIDKARLEVAPPVVFNDNMAGDRPGEPPYAIIWCSEHNSTIGVVQPFEAKPGTPVFPFRS